MEKVIELLQACFCVEPTAGKSDPAEVLAALRSYGCHFSWAVLPPDVVLEVAPAKLTHVGVCLREVSRPEVANGQLTEKLILLQDFLRERQLDCEVEGPYDKATRVSDQAVRALRYMVWVDLSSPGAGLLVAELLTEEHGPGV